MRIGIIGAGNVGRALGKRLATKHEVTFGVRNDGVGKSSPPAGTRTAQVLDAVRNAEVVILAVPAKAVGDAIKEAGSLAGKIVIDPTNAIGPGITLAAGPSGESQAERVQALVPAARVVKAFNQTGANNMENPSYGGPRPVMFYAGDDAVAKRAVAQLVEDVGFEAIDAGPLTRARELEYLAILWIALASGDMGREFVFAVERRR